MPAHLIVRSQILDPAIRDAFDDWYGDKHVPEAVAAFRPSRCWRSWSRIDPMIHYAFYEFANEDEIGAMMASDTFRAMVDDLSQTWAGKVTRERDVTVTAQLIGA